MLSIWMRKFLWLLLPIACLLAPVNCRAAAGQAMIEPHAQAMPLLPFLDYIVDQNIGMDIEEAAKATGWQPFIADNLPREEGVIWLRFTIAPLAPDARPQTFLLDMGQSVPGTPVLFDPYTNELSGAREWRENLPAQRNILLLPEASAEAVPCYIRLEGLPGPWFAPMIRTPQNAASNWGSLAQTGAILALAVVMFLCLLRGVGEKGQWRFWTAMFVAVAFLQALLGMPAVSDTISLSEIAAIMSPGIALMLLPHAGRHLLQARKYSRSIDIQLFLLAFPGAILAILPLVPGWSWLDRWLDLWPLATVIFAPTALGAWMLSIPGSRRFLLACLIPPALTGFALLGLDFGLPANILASGPSWGVALAALLLGTTPAPGQATEPAKTQAALPAANPPKAALPMPEFEPPQEEIINLEHPLDDPNLRLIPPRRISGGSLPELDEPPEIQPEPVEEVNINIQLEERENALRAPLDELMREGAALIKCSLPASARQYAEAMLDSARKLARVLSAPDITDISEEGQEKAEEGRFNLQHILRNAHDSVAASAEYSGIALSWYMPPHLAQIYQGDSRGLETTLAMLLESAVRSAHHGAIKVSARRVPDGPDPGHLLFTVTDDGNGYPPLDRSSLALARAWELTGEYGGYLSVECSQHGATIAFTAHFTPVEDESEPKSDQSAPAVILISDDPETRRLLARIIAPLPCLLASATGEQEAIAAQTRNPAQLVISQGRFARPAAADMIREMIRIARNAGLACSALAITIDESEWPLLKASGFTHAMLEPVDPEILRKTIAKLAKPQDTADAAKEPESQPEEPFYEDANALSEPVKKRDEEKAPSMLIEQHFPIAPIFEGPDWLGNQVDEELESAPEKPGAKDAPQEKTGAPQPVYRAPADAVEWVGEPMPVPQAKPENEAPEAEKTEKREKSDGNPATAPEIEEKAPESSPASSAAPVAQTAPVSHAPDDAIEWVGEPTPIVPQGSKAEEGELLDFIVSAKPEGDKKGEDSGQAGGKPVKNFMESSVNMVASTLSSLLRQKSQSEPAPATSPIAPEASIQDSGEPVKPRSDPAIIALLERLDASMRHANAAFAARNAPAIAESTGLIARDAERFGLRQLARMARCIERAAIANNMPALSDLLPELGIAVERNRITLAERNSGK